MVLAKYTIKLRPSEDMTEEQIQTACDALDDLDLEDALRSALEGGHTALHPRLGVCVCVCHELLRERHRARGGLT